MAAVLNPNDETIIGTSQKPTQDPPDIMTSDSNQMVTVMVPDVETTTGTSQNPMDDLSGVDTSPYGNPFDALISKANETYGPACFIQEAYETHRTTRNAMKKAEIISPVFGGVTPDQYLSNRLKDEEYVDPRNSLVFWARPPEEVLCLATKIQAIIKEVMPSMWLMPPEDMHTTILEVVHSVTMEEVMEVANKLEPLIGKLAAFPRTGYGCTLFRPMVSFDAAAIALSFVPCGEPPSPSSQPSPNRGDELLCTSSQAPSMDFLARPSISSTPVPPTSGPSTTIDPTHFTPRTIADFTQTILSVPPWHTNPSYRQVYFQPPPGPMHPPFQDGAPPPDPAQSSAYPSAMKPPISGFQHSTSTLQSNLPSTAYSPNFSPTQLSSSSSPVDPFLCISQSQMTYHHLRAALYSRITASGIPIASRYIVPSAHITLARYVTSSASSAYNTDPHKSEDEISHKNLVCLVHTVELINAYLSLSWKAYSPLALAAYERIENQARKALKIDNDAYFGPLLSPSLRSLEIRSQLSEMGKVRWDIRDALVCRVGALWYGGGLTVQTPER